MANDPIQPIIKTENLSVVYNKGTSNEFWALQGVDIEIYSKEYIIFFGPSGCGKSTLLNSIAGLETHITGKVTVEDKDLGVMSEDQIAKFHRESMGMIFQQYNLISSLSVLDNVTLPQVFLNIHKAERVKKAQVLLEKFGILKQADKIPSELSGGQQQRIGIARALINDPKILLADEAVGNLDSASAAVVMDLLKKLNTEDGKTLICVTHNPEYLYYANRIFYIKDGKVTREVVNNEIRPDEVKKKEEEKKKGSVEEKITEELQMLSRSFPGLTASQINLLLIPFKAKMLTNYLLSQFDVDEIARIEQIVSDRLFGRMEKSGLKMKLDQSYEIGGAGLNCKTAERLGNIVEDFIAKTNIVVSGSKGKKFGETKPADLNSPGQTASNSSGQAANRPDFNSIWSQITELRRGFIDPFHMALNDRQIMRIETAIYNRLIGDFDKNSFNEMLDRPFAEGGVGLNKATAKKITRDLEIIMLLTYGLRK